LQVFYVNESKPIVKISSMDNLSSNNINSYLTFKLGDEAFAAHVSKVLNILEMVRITKVPDMPDYMRGVINLRGNVLPVVDTRLKFNMPIVEDSVNTCIVVLEISIEDKIVNIGAIVDAVQEVIEIEPNQIKDIPSLGKRYRSEFIQGMVERDNHFIMILDMDKIFSEYDIVKLEESAQDAAIKEESIDNEKK
jgi:purine-binding chemotaxis protein CheW